MDETAACLSEITGQTLVFSVLILMLHECEIAGWNTMIC